ncbi:ATP-dependent helicase [Jatrophihabitans sp. YIM 134969]
MTRPALSAPRYRLVRPPVPRAVAPALDADQRAVVEHAGGPLRVLAGPGTGKTTTLVEAVVDRIVHRGVPVDQVLVLTFGRRAAAELRDRITARLGRTVREPVARTIHSYAYGILRLAALRASRTGDPVPSPRLLLASEQDVFLRELLVSPEVPVGWPADLLPAVTTTGFAGELRDFFARAAERGLDAVELDLLGRTHGRADWRAAARLYQQYRDVTALQRPGVFDSGELVSSAIDALESDRKLLTEERARRRHVFVDEYQDVDPSQARLLRLLAGGAAEFVVVGDPDQSIYAFRGSEPRALADFAIDLGQIVDDVALRTSRRAGSTLLAGSRRVARALGHDSPHHALVAAPGVPPGETSVRVYRSGADEAAAVAAEFRRAHLDHGVPWSRMAVLTRSVANSGPVLRRALVTAGVPVEVVGDDTPLAEAGVVDALLTALEYVTAEGRADDASDDPANASAGAPGWLAAADSTVESLLLGPLARADVLAVRRLRRWLARSAGTRPDDLPPGHLAMLVDRPEYARQVPFGAQRPVAALAAVLAAGRAAGLDLESVLWALWEASGLSGRWERQSVSGGLAGQAADRELDAVVELFDAAARYTDAIDAGTVGGFLESVRAQLLPVHRPAGANPDVVRLLTAHAAKGLEWDRVWVAGVQEGAWPDLRRRGTVLGTDVLTDIVAGQHTANTDHVAIALAEERRLFYVAVTRARERLVVSAVADAEQAPSRFLAELDPLPEPDTGSVDVPERPVTAPPRGLHLAALVAELRAVVTDLDAPDPDRAEAAAELARLAAAGVPGADPASWWGLDPLSTDGPVRDPVDGPVRISPSKLEAYQRCQLQALLGELGARDGEPSTSASLGTVVHAVASQAPDLADVPDLERRLDAVWDLLDFDAPWHARATRGAASEFLTRLAGWFSRTRSDLTVLGTEIPMAVPVGDDAELRGQVDRLELDAEGRTVVVDLKTTSSKPSKDEVAAHQQLAAYQLAVSLGAFDSVPGATRVPGGGLLVQLNPKVGGKEPEQRQEPLTDVAPVTEAVTGLARVLRGSRVLATVNEGCDRCPVRDCCPAVPTGRQVTS